MLNKILEKQKDFLRMISPDFEGLNDESKLHAMNDCLTAISNETEECRRLLPWKPWKKYKNFKLNEMEFIEETIDLFCFLLEIWVW